MSKLDTSLFVSAEVHARPVKLPDGTERDFYFRELPAIELRRQHLAETSSDLDVRDGAIARLISVGLCDVEGKSVLTQAQAAQLKPAVAGQMVAHIMEVSGFRAQPAGNV
jgi:hypothetical protein